MNNNIQEDYCSFEVSKLLKEKGFGVGQNTGYWANGMVSYTVSYEFGRPTHALAIKWVRENFGIHISSEYNYGTKLWEYTITFVEDSQKTYELIDILGVLAPEFNSSEEATDEGLLYTLKNLIP